MARLKFMNVKFGLFLTFIRMVDSVSVSSSGYIEYHEGNLGVIIAAPHGGYEEPDSIPDRDAGCYINAECTYSHSCGTKDFDNCDVRTLQDRFTKELSMLLRQEIHNEIGRYPHVIINNLHRIKLDANRDKPEAAFGETIPDQAWEEFHEFINQSEIAIGGKGLFLDIHGHGHPVDWAELGYLIYGSRLDSGIFEASDSSIYHLSTQVNVTFEELLRGEQSFGGFLEDNGFVAVPSPINPGRNGNKYFSGGYNTRQYGSRDSGIIDAIQIESSAEQRSEQNRTQYAKALAKTVKAYLEAYYPDLLTATGKAANLSDNENNLTNLTTDEATALSGNEDETTDKATTLSGNEDKNSEAVTIGGNTWVPLWAVLFVCLRSICRQNFD